LIANPDVAAAVNAGQFASGYAHYTELGKKEGRVWGIQSRIGKVLHAIDRSGHGLEIGPSHNPLTPKKYGYDVQILDHLNANDLRKKYAGHGVNVENIEEVDYVWNGEKLTDLIEDRAGFDWIIASHVVEHIPDLISFLQQCATLLKPEGKLSLVIPDKRYCFDFLNPVSSIGQLLDAFVQKRIRPSPGQIFDHYSNSCTRDGKIAWDNHMKDIPSLVHTFTEAATVWQGNVPCNTAFQFKDVLRQLGKQAIQFTYNSINFLLAQNFPSQKLHALLVRVKKKLRKLLVQTSGTDSEYVDVHCWRFTPASFRLFITDMNRLGLLDLSIVCEFDTAGCEFYVTLSKGRTNTPPEERLAILNQIQSF